MTSNQHGPYVRGYTRVTMAGTERRSLAKRIKSLKPVSVRTGVCNPTPRSFSKISAVRKEENQVKQMDKLDEKVAVGTENKEGVKDRTVEAVRSEIAVAAPPPPPAPKPEVATKVFDVVEEMPSFPGGQGALMQYLASNIKYPVVAQENGVQGRVIVSFVVERDGSISDVKVARSVDPSLDREAQRVVKSMPRWSPGKQNGSTVRVKYTVPVVFRLQ